MSTASHDFGDTHVYRIVAEYSDYTLHGFAQARAQGLDAPSGDREILYGPYMKLATARGVMTRLENNYPLDSDGVHKDYYIEKSPLVWEKVSEDG